MTSRIVYVTPTGNTVHLHRDCTHIRGVAEATTYDQVEDLKTCKFCENRDGDNWAFDVVRSAYDAFGQL